jgi:hypothetical protein
MLASITTMPSKPDDEIVELTAVNEDEAYVLNRLRQILADNSDIPFDAKPTGNYCNLISKISIG